MSTAVHSETGSFARVLNVVSLLKFLNKMMVWFNLCEYFQVNYHEWVKLGIIVYLQVEFQVDWVVLCSREYARGKYYIYYELLSFYSG
jgi:hypothetical protein